MYPIHKKGFTLTTAIINQDEPQDDWKLCPYIKLYGKYRSFAKANEKCAQAEGTSDMESAPEEKETRSGRTKKKFTDFVTDVPEKRKKIELIAPKIPLNLQSKVKSGRKTCAVDSLEKRQKINIIAPTVPNDLQSKVELDKKDREKALNNLMQRKNQFLGKSPGVRQTVIQNQILIPQNEEMKNLRETKNRSSQDQEIEEDLAKETDDKTQDEENVIIKHKTEIHRQKPQIQETVPPEVSTQDSESEQFESQFQKILTSKIDQQIPQAQKNVEDKEPNELEHILQQSPPVVSSHERQIPANQKESEIQKTPVQDTDNQQNSDITNSNSKIIGQYRVVNSIYRNKRCQVLEPFSNHNDDDYEYSQYKEDDKDESYEELEYSNDSSLKLQNIIAAQQNNGKCLNKKSLLNVKTPKDNVLLVVCSHDPKTEPKLLDQIFNLKQMIRMTYEMIYALIERDETGTEAISHGIIQTYFPLDSLKKLKEFEQLIKVDKTKKQQLLEYMNSEGETNARVMALNLLNNVFSNKVSNTVLQEDFTWAGKKTKSSFRDLEICRCMKGAVIKSFSKSSVDEISKIMETWIKNVKQRLLPKA